MADMYEMQQRFLAEEAKKRNASGPSKEQRARVAASGESSSFRQSENSHMPSMLDRIQANVSAGIARTPTDLLTLGGMIPPMVRAGLSSELDLPEAMMGKEGLAEFSSYVQTNAEKMFNELPKGRQTDANYQAISDAVGNTKEAEEIRLKHSNAAIRLGTQGSNAINAASGLGRVSEETSTDELQQIVGGALIPIGSAAGAVASAGRKAATSGARRVVESVAESMLPGTTGGVGNLAANVGVQTGVSQGLRALSDQPSLVTGDAFTAEGDQYTMHDPDADSDAGMGSKFAVEESSLAASLAVGAAILSGKGNRVGTKAAMDAVDDIKIKIDDIDTSMPETQTLGSKINTAFDDTAPMRDLFEQAAGGARTELFNKHIGDIERAINHTSGVHISQVYNDAANLGNMPNLDRKTVPLKMLNRREQQLSPEEMQLHTEASIAASLLDTHALKRTTLEEDMRMENLGIRTGSDMSILKSMEKQKAEFDDVKLQVGPEKQMTIAEAKQLVALRDANPKLSEIDMGYKMLARDMIESRVRGGHITKEVGDKLSRTNPNYMMLQEADPKVPMWDRIATALKGTDRPQMFGNVRGPLDSRSAEGVVKNPVGPQKAARIALTKLTEYEAINNGKKAWVNTMKLVPEQNSVRDVHKMTVDDYYKHGKPDKIAKLPMVDAYTADGYMHFFQVADPLTYRALQFHAPVTAGLGLNLMRRLSQQGTTGVFAPETAPRSAKYDADVISKTRQKGRSFGFFDSRLRRAFPDNEKLGAALDMLGGTMLGPVNTSSLQMIGAVFQGISYKTIMAVAQKISEDLEVNSGLFAHIAKTPEGKQSLLKASEAVVRTLNETRYGMAVNSHALDARFLDDPFREINDGMNAVSFAGKGNEITQKVFMPYKAMLESIHNSAKVAFFTQNLAILEAKYKGRANIPQKELDKLVSETRLSSGDMTRTPGSYGIAKAASAIPYGNIMINSMLHVAQNARRNPLTVGSRILTGSVIPRMISTAAIVSVPGVADWYFNDIPIWQRLSTTPVIGPDWWMDAVTGNARALTPNDVYLVAETPEIGVFGNMAVTMFNALGMFNSEAAEQNFSPIKELVGGLESIGSFASPGILTLLLNGGKLDVSAIPGSFLTGDSAFQEGFNEDPQQYNNITGINNDSIFSRGMKGAMVAMFGTSADMILTSLDTGMQTYDETGQVDTAVKQAFGFEGYQRERRMMELPGTREAGAYLFTSGQRRQYATTARREHVTETLRKFDEVKEQLRAENDKNGSGARAEAQGMQGYKKIKDPQALQLAEQLNEQFSSGGMKKSITERTALKSDLMQIEHNKDTLSPALYHLKTLEVNEKIKAVDKEQAALIGQIEADLLRRYNLDIDGAIGAIMGAVSR